MLLRVKPGEGPGAVTKGRARGKRTFGASALDTLTQWLKLYEHNLLGIDTFIEKNIARKKCSSQKGFSYIKYIYANLT